MNFPESLQQAVDDARARVRIGFPWWLRLWVARDVTAITLGRTIYLSHSAGQRTGAALSRLLRHELVHVKQVNRLGLSIFLWRYVTEFLRHWWRERSVSKAYRRISFEVEAWAEEEREAV